MASEVATLNQHDTDFDPTPKTPDRSLDDADTCRICRGEGTLEEPLFFPCKCSGSIKFVHQECLMEWLSHSQKKYCELCKTPFRFTKLYHPGMPTNIPTTVFIRRAALHVLKMLITWCRGVLVGSVWLLLLPFLMRLVWRSLFWVGDGGWVRDFYADTHTEPAQSTPPPSRALDLAALRSAIESAKVANNTSVSVSLTLPSALMPYSQTLNMSAGEPTIWTLMKRFLFGFQYPLPDSPSTLGANETISNVTANPFGSRSPSLLSDISFFEWFPSQSANRFVIDVLEGQIITLLVVVAFILIFLIREWVVQQQPVINMVAINEGAAVDRAHEQVDQVINVREMEAQVHREDDLLEREVEVDEDEDEDEDDGPHDEEYAPHETHADDGETTDEDMDDIPLPVTFPVRRRTSSTQAPRARDSDHNPVTFPERSSSLPRQAGSVQGTDGLEPPTTPRRPDMPARNRSFIATEIRRSMEETNTWSFSNAPSAVGGPSSRSADAPDVPESWESEEATSSPNRGNYEGVSDQEQDSEHSSESWQQVSHLTIDGDGNGLPEQSATLYATQPSVSDTVNTRNGSLLETEDDSRTSNSINEHVRTDDVSSGENGISDVQEDASGTDNGITNAESDELRQPTDQDVAPGLQQEQPPRRIMDIILDWLFGDVAPDVRAAEDDANDERVVQDLAEEAPFVAFAANEAREPANPPIQDPEVAAAAAQAGIDLNDQDAIDDAEDLEGIMELIGMQGPLTGLFQNAMFSAVLISATLACAVWFPYLCGKVVLLFMGSPLALFVKIPLQFIATLCDFVVDMSICLGAGAVFWVAQFTGFFADILTLGRSSDTIRSATTFFTGPARSVTENAMDRIAQLLYGSSHFPHPDYFRLSINSHVALRTIQNTTSYALNQTGNAVATMYGTVTAESPSQTAFWMLKQLPKMAGNFLLSAYSSTSTFGTRLWASKSYNITWNLDPGYNATSAVAALEPWTASDRSIAVLAGYGFFAMVGALYLKRGSPISTSPQGRKIEQIIAEILQQAGGVLKVILIISIEMLVFPLYCGLLLDFALLPLFSNANVYTRWQFARQSPWTSGFVHWFLGTCYMFHFALFVSMCRKIMRRGVLYFIRDPDDPTFHPVRDVLERSVTTQLRKIAFSALVYGGLVIVCLGGVVWSLYRATKGVLPIHFATQAPSLEFPLDLLFYNFLTPLIIKVYKPSDGMHAIYQWWFKACARVLRLSNFLFGEKVRLEEGRLVKRPWHSPFTSWFTRSKSQGQRLVPEESDADSSDTDSETPEDFEFQGRYVRAPASDQVRIPKGERVFIDVNHDNERLDGKQDEGGVHNSDMVTMVYIPPWFRARIALFVLSIWIFAAVTGVGITVLPLLFGRYLFSLFLPATVEMNDIHAFSLGVYTLGTIGYSIWQLTNFIYSLRRPVPSPISTLVTIAATASKFGLKVLRFTYVWSSFVFLFPFLFAVLLELYFLMPLHAYLGPSEPHVVHIIQDWTLGFLYARLAARVLAADRASRASRAFSAVMADGYLNPNARLATRCFLLPVWAIFIVAVAVPATISLLLNKTIWAGADDATRAQVWRFSFPLLGLMLGTVWLGREGAIILMRWRMVVRDEVYLIGERLHNFGDRRPPPPPLVQQQQQQQVEAA